MSIKSRPITTKAAWSLADYAYRLEQCIDWAKSEGIDVGPNSRYRAYLRLLKSAVNGHISQRRKFHGEINTSHDTFKVLRETKEIDRVRRYFVPNKPLGYQSKLAKIMNGPVHSINEKEDGGKVLMLEIL